MRTVACACCEQSTAFVALVHRDGHECGPKVAICSSCADLPIRAVWRRIAKPSPMSGAYYPVHLIVESLPSVEQVRARA